MSQVPKDREVWPDNTIPEDDNDGDGDWQDLDKIAPGWEDYEDDEIEGVQE